MPIGAELPSHTTMLLNRPIRDLLPQTFREPINIDKDDAQYEVSWPIQYYVKDNDT